MFRNLFCIILFSSPHLSPFFLLEIQVDEVGLPDLPFMSNPSFILSISLSLCFTFSEASLTLSSPLPTEPQTCPFYYFHESYFDNRF